MKPHQLWTPLINTDVLKGNGIVCIWTSPHREENRYYGNVTAGG